MKQIRLQNPQSFRNCKDLKHFIKLYINSILHIHVFSDFRETSKVHVNSIQIKVNKKYHYLLS